MKPLMIIVTVIGVAALASGVGVLIWWLVTRDNLTTTVLEGDGLGVSVTAAVARLGRSGDMFWMFYQSDAANPTTRPLFLWLDGVTGVAPSLLANFGMFGPLDLNLNRRTGSWVEEFNLLLIDAPLGTGFSTARSDNTLAHNFEETTDHLLLALESFYSTHGEYGSAPLYVFGQGDGAQLALHMVTRISQTEVPFGHNLQGIVLGNPVVSPALALTKLGFYLDEMGYVDPTGRIAVEQYTTELNALVNTGQLEEAFDIFLNLEDFLNEEIGTTAVNVKHIIQKLTRETNTRDFFGHRAYMRSALQLDIDFNEFMTQRVAPALRLSNANFDQRREAAVQALRGVYMEPTTHLVEYILTNTLAVIFYNGNLDAVSNTPGQLEWINNLQWSGQTQFLNSTRQTLAVNGLVEGYFKETDRLTFYWMNAAGVSVPLDSPTAMRRVVQRITGS